MNVPKVKFKLTFCLVILILLSFVFYRALLKYPNLIVKIDDIVSSNTKIWKTYTNSKYGYSFKYPPHWKIIDTNPSKVSLLKLTHSSLSYEHFYSKPSLKYSGEISFSCYPPMVDDLKNTPDYFNITNLEEYIEKGDIVEKLGTIDFANQKATEFIAGGYSLYYTILTIKNDRLYELFFDDVSGKKYLSPTHKAIISSYKFLY